MTFDEINQDQVQLFCCLIKFIIQESFCLVFFFGQKFLSSLNR